MWEGGCPLLRGAQSQKMRVCIGGPERLNNDSLEAIIDNWKGQNPVDFVFIIIGRGRGGGGVELFGGKVPCPPPPS